MSKIFKNLKKFLPVEAVLIYYAATFCFGDILHAPFLVKVVLVRAISLISSQKFEERNRMKSGR